MSQRRGGFFRRLADALGNMVGLGRRHEPERPISEPPPELDIEPPPPQPPPIIDFGISEPVIPEPDTNYNPDDAVDSLREAAMRNSTSIDNSGNFHTHHARVRVVVHDENGWHEIFENVSRSSNGISADYLLDMMDEYGSLDDAIDGLYNDSSCSPLGGLGNIDAYQITVVG